MNKRLFFSAVLCSGYVAGCTTIDTISDKDVNNKIFSGTLRHVELACAHAVCIDAPFSFAVDVVLLPVTIPWSIYNVATESSEHSSPVQHTQDVPAALQRPNTK